MNARGSNPLSDLESERSIDDDVSNVGVNEIDLELFGLSDSSSFLEILKVMISQSLPVIISFSLQMGGNFITLIFAGHYKDDNMSNSPDGDSTVFAGISLCNMFVAVTYYSIFIGMTGAIETLGSQHNGAGHYAEVGYVFQRSCCILAVLVLPILVIWYFAYDIFAAIGVEDKVCEVIQQFLNVRALTIPLDVVNESYKKYLITIGVMKPGLISNICLNVLILSFNILFVDYLHLHYKFLAYSWVLAVYISAAVQLIVSLQYEEVQRTLQPLSFKHALSDWYEFFNLGLPGTVMLCSEWWAFEILTVFASFLGNEQVAAEAIILQTASLSFMVPLGVASASSSLVGNSLGASKVALASSIGKIAIFTIIAFEILVGLLIYFFGTDFVSLFTEDVKVINIVDSVIPFLSLFVMLDGLQGTGAGIFRGAGKQMIGAVGNVIAFYGVGLPMAWFACFKFGFGVAGLIMGVSFGTVVQVAVLLTGIFCFENYLYSAVVKSDSGGFQKLRSEDDDTLNDEEVWNEDDDEFVEIELYNRPAQK